jgi:SRSO17 transposase
MDAQTAKRAAEIRAAVRALVTSLAALVRLAKLRWRVERDDQELKQQIGLDHYEGRTWRGFHHHATRPARPAS